MRNWTAAIIVALAAGPIAAASTAAAGQPATVTLPETGGEGERFYAADVPPPIVRQEAGRLHVARPVFGSGYVPYRYPALDTCPCDDGGCYHPGWYYCGGRAYRETWWRRWGRAHLGHGSMLDASPCHCVLPTFGRSYRLPTTDVAPVDEHVLLLSNQRPLRQASASESSQVHRPAAEFDETSAP